jgi:ABC-type nitrate/sulfonate/bicarbonate transport system substrate-binding protein
MDRKEKMNRRNLLIGLGAAAFAGIDVASGAQAAKERPDANRPLTRLQVGGGLRVTNAALHLGVERGYFRQEGLDLQMVDFGGQAEVLPGVISGAQDVGLLGFGPGLWNAISRGGKVKFVLARDALLKGCSEQGTLFYRQERFPKGIEKGDWKGMRVALTTEATTTQFYLQQLLAARGMTEADVEISRMRMEESVAAASAGRLDVFFGSGRPEWIAGGLPKNIRRSDLLLSVLGTFQYTFVVFGAKLLDGDPAIGTAFARAYLRAVRRFVAGDNPKFLDELAARMHLDPKLVKSACRTGTSTSGEIRMQDLVRWIKWYQERKQMPGDIPAEKIAAQMVDLRFQKAAIGTL